MDSRSSCASLAFLLSLGTVPLACTDGDDGGSASGTTGDTTATTTMTTGATTTTTDGTASGTAGTTATTATTTTAGTTATTGETTTTTGESTTGEPGSLCEQVAAKYIECNPDGVYREELAYCQQQLDVWTAIGPECQAAGEVYFMCVATKNCSTRYACDSESTAVSISCLPEPGPACSMYAAKVGGCNMGTPEEIQQYAGYCQYGVDMAVADYGQACGDAFEEYYACIAALDCAEIEDGSPTCDPALMKVEGACGG